MSSEWLLLPEHQGLAVVHTAITTSVSLVNSTGLGGLHLQQKLFQLTSVDSRKIFFHIQFSMCNRNDHFCLCNKQPLSDSAACIWIMESLEFPHQCNCQVACVYKHFQAARHRPSLDEYARESLPWWHQSQLIPSLKFSIALLIKHLIYVQFSIVISLFYR